MNVSFWLDEELMAEVVRDKLLQGNVAVDKLEAYRMVKDVSAIVLSAIDVSILVGAGVNEGF
jgi:hypothetical protein